MKKVWPFLVVIVVIIVIAALALGNKNNKNATTPPAAPSSNQSSTEPMSNPGPSSSNSSTQPQSTNSVSIVNMDFTPSSITVKKGTTVTWTNNDSVAHTVTADTNNAFDSGNLNPGKNFSHTFDTAGTFAYHCTYHSNMHGSVTVTE